MFDTYKDIFDRRGREYNFAMTAYPDARQEEFANLIELLELRDGDKIVDIPSGGCYLKSFIDKDVSITYVDSSEIFLSYCQEDDRVVCSDVTDIPLEAASFDKVHSLAGIHHLADKAKFYREAARLLKSGGIFAMADVEKDSITDSFLNVFVDKFNTMGHKGDFLERDQVIAAMNNCGFEVKTAKPVRHFWQFNSEEAMIDFTKNLFGLDNATEDEIFNGIEKYTEYEKNDRGISMAWELLYFQAVRL